MRPVFLVAVIFLFASILPVCVFSQTDDNDGDGIPNSEDLCPGTKGTRANKGCPAEEKKAGPVVAVTPKPMATPAPTPRPVLAAPTSPALADCRYIIEDAGCRKFYGKSGEELRAVLGQTPKNGVVPQLGIWFYMWAPTSDGTPTVAEVTFYGTDIEDLKRFYGNPGEKIDWTATRDDVVRNYGVPTKESSWKDSTTDGLTLYYGSNLWLEFNNGKLAKVSIRYSKHNDDTAAYFENQKKKYFEEKAQKEAAVKQAAANQEAKATAEAIMRDYDTVHEQIEAKIREAERIIASERLAIVAGSFFRDAVKKKIDRQLDSARGLIDNFLRKYDGRLPAWMKKHLLEDRAKLVMNYN